MTEKEKENVIRIVNKTATAKQLTFINSYLRHDKYIPDVSKELNTTPQNCYQTLKADQIQMMVAINNLPITEGSKEVPRDVVPTLEYLNEQWEILYNRAIENEDDKVAAQILDKRMKYYEMFENLRKEDKVNLSKLTIKELVEYEQERHKKTISLLTEGENNEWKTTVTEVIA